jgi:hypothetical protein
MLRKFISSKRGNVAPAFAIALVPLVIVFSGSIDMASTSQKAAKLQDSLDATALAIATKYHSGMSDSQLHQLGLKFFHANNRYSVDEELIVDPDAAAEFSASATRDGRDSIISVKSTVDHDAVFNQAVLWTATRASYVRVAPGQPACVLALNEHAKTSVKIQGSTTVELKKCVIASNSDALDSVYRGGSAQLNAECVSTVGGVVGVSSSNLACGMPLGNQYPSDDPLYDVVPPPYGSCGHVPGGKDKTLPKGTYCGRNLTGDVKLEAGTYIFKGGSIKLGGNGSLVGAGVTIFLMEGAQITTNGNETVNLSPPTEGPYKGITIYQEKGNTNELKINGGSSSSLTGFIYAPSAPVFFAGNSNMSGEGDCIRIVGDTVEMTGNSAIATDCSGVLGNREIYAGKIITLVK